MNPQGHSTITPPAVSHYDQIIDEIASYIKGEELEIQSGIAPIQKQQIWENLFKGNFLPLIKSTQNQNNEMLGIQITISFLKKLTLEHKAVPLKLALSQKNNKIYVWAEIADNDEKTMDAILASIIDANYENMDGGITLSPMIVEQKEAIPVPPQYKMFSVNA